MKVPIGVLGTPYLNVQNFTFRGGKSKLFTFVLMVYFTLFFALKKYLCDICDVFMHVGK